VSRHAAGAPFVAIDWSAWAETGMGTDPALLGLLRARGFRPLSTDAGGRAFERIIRRGARGQVAVIDIAPSFAGRIRGFEGTESAEVRAPPAALLVPATVQPPASNGAGGIEHQLRAMVAGALRVPPEEIPPERSFLALGLQSLVAVDLVKDLERR